MATAQRRSDIPAVIDLLEADHENLVYSLFFIFDPLHVNLYRKKAVLVPLFCEPAHFFHHFGSVTRCPDKEPGDSPHNEYRYKASQGLSILDIKFFRLW